MEVASAGLRKPAPGYAATVAEVAIDPQTGVVHLTRLFIAQDVGRAINRLAVEGQIQGAAIQSAGMALWEEVQYDAQGQRKIALGGLPRAQPSPKPHGRGPPPHRQGASGWRRLGPHVCGLS